MKRNRDDARALIGAYSSIARSVLQKERCTPTESVPECPIPASVFTNVDDKTFLSKVRIRLLTDPRMNLVWADFKTAATKAQRRMERPDWMLLVTNLTFGWMRSQKRSGIHRMTDAERSRWLKETKATVRKLRALLDRVDDAFLGDDPGMHFPLQENGEPLLHFLKLLGVPYKPKLPEDAIGTRFDKSGHRASR
jgi:hypothetical protein